MAPRRAVKALFLSPLDAGDLGFAVSSAYTCNVHYGPVLVDRMAELAATHSLIERPTPAEVGQVMDGIWLSPDFYRECGKRIDAALRGGRGAGSMTLARRLVDCAEAGALRLRQHLQRIPSGPDRTAAAMTAIELVEPLLAVMEAAHSAPGRPWEDPASGVEGVSVAESVAAAHGVMAAMAPFLPPKLLESIVESQPGVIFFCGEIPRRTPQAIALALRLRPRLPRVPFVLWHREPRLFSSFAHVRKAALEDGALFEIFDAVSLYTDLEDKVFCDILDRVAAGRSLAGVEGLARRGRSAVEVCEPAPESLAGYLDAVRLGPLSPVAGSQRPEDANPWHAHALEIAKIIPAKQSCYWDQCRFCGTTRQSFVKKDPHLDRRGLETAELLVELRDRGHLLSAVGEDVVPPKVLTAMVERLRSERHPPRWFFEGKLDPVFTPRFAADLKAAGCVGTIMGLECASDRLHALVHKHVPGMDMARIEQVIAGLDEAGIAVHVNTIHDLPTTTPAELEGYRRWLRSMFDRCRLFTFNTNTFKVAAVSRMARSPSRYGLRLVDLSGSGRLCEFVPFTRTQASAASGEADTIWRRVFGVAQFRGVAIGDYQVRYVERTACAFLDAMSGRNLMKDLQRELSEGRHVGSARVSLPATVDVVDLGAGVPARDGSGAAVWLVDARGTGARLALQPAVWRVLEQATSSKLTVDQAALVVLGAALPSVRPRVHERVRDLAASGLLLVDG